MAVLIKIELSVADGAAIAGVTAQQVLAAAERLSPVTGAGSMLAVVQQSWALRLGVPAGADPSELAARLEETLQPHAPSL